MITPEAIKEAFHKGTLLTKSIDQEGALCWRRIGAVHRFHNEEEMIEITTPQGTSRVTASHKVFVSLDERVDAKDLQGVVWSGEGPMDVTTRAVPPEEEVFDLAVDDPSRFVLAQSNILVSNSPDRNYQFRPPEQEGQIGQYNRVFGYIWEDYELAAYLQMSLDWFMSLPPQTINIQNLDQLCAQMPAWRSWILWGAAVYALFALSLNWVANEFSVEGTSKVKVTLPDGREVSLSIQELHGILYG